MKKKVNQSITVASHRFLVISKFLALLTALSLIGGFINIITKWLPLTFTIYAISFAIPFTVFSGIFYAISQDKDVLKSQYVVQHDERNIAICRRSLAWMVPINVILMLVCVSVNKNMTLSDFLKTFVLYELLLYIGLHSFFAKRI